MDTNTTTDTLTKVSLNWPGGFCETHGSLDEARAAIQESADAMEGEPVDLHEQTTPCQTYVKHEFFYDDYLGKFAGCILVPTH